MRQQLSTTLEDRIASLERTHRRYRRALACAILGALVLTGISATRPDEPADVVRAGRFELIGSDGRTYAQIKPSDGTGAIVLMDKAGDPMVALAGSRTRSGQTGRISLYDQKRETVMLGATDEGNGVISTYSAQGKKLAELGSWGSNEGFIAAFDGRDNPVIVLASKDDHGVINIKNERGMTVGLISVDGFGNGAFNLLNSKGVVAAALQVDGNGAGAVSVFDGGGSGRTLAAGQ